MPSFGTKKQVLKVGVTETRYVSLAYCRPWVIHAYRSIKGRGFHKDEEGDASSPMDEENMSKNTTLEDDVSSTTAEKLHEESSPLCKSCPEAARADITEDKVTSFEVRSENYEKVKSATAIVEDLNIDSEFGKGQSTDTEIGNKSDFEQPSTSAETRAQRQCEVPGDTEQPVTMEPPAKSSYDKVRLICQPWRKPEGGINRPVLKMMLESVMLFLMLKPASSINAVYNRFSPYIQPMVLKNIVEILEDIGCITRQYIRPGRVSLFSKPFQTSIAEEDSEDCQDILLPTLECMYRLGQFGQAVYPGVVWPELEGFTL